MMNKRIFSVLMILAMLIACFSVSAAAVEEKDVVQVLSCDAAFGTFTVNTAQKTEGRGSFQLSLKDEGFKFANQTELSPVKNISNADTLAFDVYVSDPTKILTTFAELTIELTSSGKCDDGEIAFHLHGELKGYAQEMKAGWNTVYVYFESASYTSNPNQVDLTKINYVRIFGTNTGAAGLSKEVLLLDNFRVCNTGGPSFEDLPGMVQFRGDNSDVTIEIEGMDVPDANNRQNEVSIKEGEKLAEADKVVVGESGLTQPSISVNPDEQPSGGISGGASSGTSQIGGADDSDVTVDTPDVQDGAGASGGMSLKLVAVICGAVLVLAIAVLALVVVASKAKKKD